MQRSARRSIRGAVILLLASALVAAPLSGAWAVGPGAPPRPTPPATPDSSLTAHALTTNAGPLLNPLKGFASFYQPGGSPNSGFPRSLTWSYFGLSEVMTDPNNCNTLNWSLVESTLNDIAATGNQAAIRFYIEYPGGSGTHPAVATPPCFAGHVANRSYGGAWDTTSPDYDSPFLLTALTNFITAYGAKYDGDPRIGFINMGLVGLWGEWHTWPFDTDTTSDSNPNYMPTDAHAAQIIQAYDAAFNKTKLEVRYAGAGGGAANNLDIGYHDDSFCYREGSPLAGVTLPVSMGGASYSQLQGVLDQGVENKWITNSMGGEVRPEIQTSAYSFWPGGSGAVDNAKACIELEHTTWKINEGSQGYSASDPNVQAAYRLMGYNLGVSNAYFKNTASGTTNVGVQLKNTGVAPFYYPWVVSLGLKNSGGTVVKTWDTSWDLRTVMPLKIRAFPNWNVGADPTYLDYGYPQYFQAPVDLSGVAQGSYQLVMSVKNPLAPLSANAKKFLFANDTQNADGWLGLGAMTVGTGTADTTAPTTPTALTAPSKTSSTVSLSWTASTDNVGVTGYRVLRNGTQVGTPTGTTYTDTGLTASTAYSYTVVATDAAGNASSASSALSVTTSAGSTPGSGYEAEAAGNTLTGTAVVAACSTCSGGSKVGYVGNGATLRFNGVTGGTTTLQVYYSSAVARAGTVQINGGTATSVSFPATADWTTVGSISVNVAIPAGSSNTVTIANASDWAPDIDRITTGGSGGGSDTTAPSTPTALTSPSKTSTSVLLSWTASTDNVGVTGYQVFRGATQVGTPTGASYTDSGLTASTAYSYTVRAVDAAGNVSSGSSALSVTTNATGGTDTTLPSTPNGLTSPSKTSTSVSLSWNAATDNVGVTGYRVLRNGTQVGTTSALVYTDSGLTASTAYTYQVAAYDAAGNVSGASSSIVVTTSAGSTPGGGYEAEAAGNTLTGTAVVASCAACSGGSKVGYVGNGATLRFNGVTGGTTTLRIYYLSAVARTASLQINGGTATSVSFPATADWNTVGSVLVTVSIPSGTTNTVTLGNASDWAPDIDRITTG